MLNNQKFRQVYLEGVDASLQRNLPNLQQRNFLFDYNYAISHNLTRSLRFNFNAATSSIIRQEQDVNNPFLDPVNSADRAALWQGLLNTGEPNTHFQSLSLNYKLPFQYIPILSFIDATYNYTGNFNWIRGSEALSQVVSENGIPLGIVNTIQNNNTKTLTAAVSFAKLYTALGLKSRSSNFTSQPRRPQAVNDSSAVKKNTVLKKSITRAVDLLTAIKRIQISYNENNGSVIPGYLPSVGFAGSMRPTLGYTLGSQADIRYEAARQGWLTAFPNFNQSFTQLRSNRFKSTAQVVPFEGLIIDINAERDFAENVMENFSIQNQEYFPRNSNRYGNFGMSTVLVQTAFKNGRGITHENFEDFRNNRLILAQRLAENSSIDTTEKDAEGYPTGFGKNQQAVILHSFLAAYSGVDAAAVSLDPFRQTPLPNWNLKFTGLTKLKPIADLFSRFSLNHAYRASYTLTNFQTNFDYNPQLPNALDKAGNQIPEILYSNVNLVEQFNPLARIDMEFTNSLRVLAEIRKERAISLSLDNNLITESLGDEYVVGLGYRIQEVRFRTSIGDRRVILNGDLNIKADVSYRDNVTVLRNLEYDNNQVTAGQRLMSIKIAADYALTRNLTALFFYDHNFSEFAISTAFPQTSVRSGFTIRYNFGN